MHKSLLISYQQQKESEKFIPQMNAPNFFKT